MKKITILLLFFSHTCISTNFMMENHTDVSDDQLLKDVLEIEELCAKYLPALQRIIQERLSLHSDSKVTDEAPKKIFSSNLFLFIELKKIAELTRETNPELYSTTADKKLLEAFATIKNTFLDKADSNDELKNMVSTAINYQCTALYGYITREWCAHRYFHETLGNLKECSKACNACPVPGISSSLITSLIESLEEDNLNTYDILNKCFCQNSKNFFKTILRREHQSKESIFVYDQFDSFQKNFENFEASLKNIDKILDTSNRHDENLDTSAFPEFLNV